MSVGIPVQDQELMPQCRILEEQMAATCASDVALMAGMWASAGKAAQRRHHPQFTTVHFIAFAPQPLTAGVFALYSK